MILTLNCGSQSFKWKIFNQNLTEIANGSGSYFKQGEARKIITSELKKIKAKYPNIEFISHRIVHGGKFFEPVYINNAVLKEIKKYSILAPLHNPFGILGIRLAKKEFLNAKQIAVFDTEFFKNLPEVSKEYPLPENIKKRFLIRRFGFHGISHKYLANLVAKKLKKQLNKLNLITIHLGGGASITAIKKGKPIETSMGFTPLAGLLMNTRSGDIDPGLVLFLVKKTGLKKTEEILNLESGLKAISGTANYKKIISFKNKKSENAFKSYIWHLKKYLGGYYYGFLGGNVEAIVFGGKIGAGLPITRKSVLKNFPLNKKTKIFALESDENFQMAKETKENFFR